MKLTKARVLKIAKILESKFDWEYNQNTINEVSEVLYKTCPELLCEKQTDRHFDYRFYEMWMGNLGMIKGWSADEDSIPSLAIAVYLSGK